MGEFKVVWVADTDHRRDYRERQEYANEQNCDLYVEHHFNASAYDKPGIQDNPSLCVVASNASRTSKDIASTYSAKVAYQFGVKDSGAVQVKFKGRGDYNLRYTNMPALILEPLFVSDEELAVIAQSDVGQEQLAQILVDTIREHFPAGGTIAFSVGHKFKVSSPYDRGAPVAGTNGKVGEADLAEPVLRLAARMLETKDDSGETEVTPQERRIEFKGAAKIEAVGDLIIITLPPKA